MVMAGTLAKKWLAALTRDERFKKNVQGLQATIVTLHKCYHFVESIHNPEGQFGKRVQAIREILQDKRLEKLRSIDIYKALSVQTLGYYNHLLKAKLHPQMEELLSFIYETDLYIAVSEVARIKRFNYAKALPAEENILRVKDLCHPCIDKAVGNDLLLEQNSNVLFLTGANMAGKSTLMKSVGIVLYLAHMGFPVAVTEMEFSVRDGLYSSINVSDNIGLGYSHFYAEVVRVKQAARCGSQWKAIIADVRRAVQRHECKRCV